VGAAVSLRAGLPPSPGILASGQLQRGAFAAWAQGAGAFAATGEGPLDTLRVAALAGARAPGTVAPYVGAGPAVEVYRFQETGGRAQVAATAAVTAQAGAGAPITGDLRAELFVEGGVALHTVELAWGTAGLLLRIE
jgi:hypothetical protein